MTGQRRRSRLVGERAPAPAALLEGGGGDGGGHGEPHRRHRIRTLRSAFRLPGPPVLEGRGARHQAARTSPVGARHSMVVWW